MRALGLAAFLLACSLLALPLSAQQTTSTSTSPALRDAQGVSLVQQTLLTMTQGMPISDATLSGSAARTTGPDQESGQVTLEAKGTQESKVALTLSGSTYIEVRNLSDGSPNGSYAGSDGLVHQLAQHNCFTEASWFFPPLSSLLSALNNPAVNISYLGQETLGGNNVQHIRVWLSVSSPDAAAAKSIASLSTVDWFLDSASALPVVERFSTHPPDNASVDIEVEIRFSNYQRASGILLPFHIQKFLNGGLALDLTVSAATLNSGLSDSDFIMD